MEIILTPEYHDLFPGEEDNLEQLLIDIPSLLILKLISMINAELYANDKGQFTQTKIFNLLLGRQPASIKDKIINNAQEKVRRNPNEQTHFFSTLYNMNFLHYELVNFRELPMNEITPEQDLRLFKAYFLVVEEVNKVYRSTLKKTPEYDAEYFGKMTWPTLIDQFELNYKLEPYTIMIRGSVFFNYIQCHSQYSMYVKEYLDKHKKVTALNYLLDIYNILISGYNKTKENQESGWASFKISRTDGFDTLFEQFNLTEREYQQVFKNGKSNYSGIKSKPLYAYDNNNWLILSWPFLINKMYEGLLFDFYNISGIKIEKKFKQFIDFKNFVGEKITEEYLSRKLLRSSFRSKYQTIFFDDKSRQGLPDCYYRKGNKVILFEIKDAYFPASAINSFSYDKITEAIDLKMNNDGKGTGQILKQLGSLIDQSIEKPQGYKHVRNLQIYPVIVYADLFFNMPGINHYLENSFGRKIKELNLDKEFKSVHPLTLINITFLISSFDLFDGKQLSLISLMDHYHKFIIAKQKRAEKTRDLNDHINSYQPFEQVVSHLLPYDKSERDYVKATIEALDLSEGLPR
ncbi:hypothetical protein [Mucilaginibacter flavus]|uniref:hypothetical protein n=1 Tax=Mucilaginibacter flavus TaxID=931504 RepID=UPI0025B51531|nr:hypothetical protein [Mucilaginibacter flavus]MDN3582848.1 hypothetical protein [Mucilaginibacter flavus]